MLVHERSRGIARTINVICDNALLSGMALGRRPVGREIVMEVCEDFDLRRSGELPGGGRMGPGLHREESVPVDAASERTLPDARIKTATSSL
jgi:hypothetical protein